MTRHKEGIDGTDNLKPEPRRNKPYQDPRSRAAMMSDAAKNPAAKAAAQNTLEGRLNYILEKGEEHKKYNTIKEYRLDQVHKKVSFGSNGSVEVTITGYDDKLRKLSADTMNKIAKANKAAYDYIRDYPSSVHIEQHRVLALYTDELLQQNINTSTAIKNAIARRKEKPSVLPNIAFSKLYEIREYIRGFNDVLNTILNDPVFLEE